jgi:hypothetical protein
MIGGVIAPGFASPHVMPPITDDPPSPPRLELGELITTISTTDGTLEAHKGGISALANGSYSVNINYLLNGTLYRVNLVVNPDGTGAIDATGESLYLALQSHPVLLQTIQQQSSAYVSQLPSTPPTSGETLPPILGLTDCQTAWINLAVSAISKSWIGVLWGIIKVISACF